ncbi:hypothetical protein ABZY02_10285 [Streptomyces sp. NPDC006649]|uniref:hypothetical protein n=1 Tax=Streptomyces sp. NPDC006649 TaxID=3156896 RepID=UPI0033B3B18F
MSDIPASLGPLERVDGRWAVGNCRRPGGTWLEFRADGLYQHAGDSGNSLKSGNSAQTDDQLIPWSRVMSIGFTLGAKYPPMGSYGMRALLGGLPGPWKGRGHGYVHMTLRHPYENGLAAFDRHPYWYNLTHLALFEELLRQIASEGEAHRFADADWLGRAVELLARDRPRTRHAMREAVAAARQV